MDEFSFIKTIEKTIEKTIDKQSRSTAFVEVGIGDDCAVLGSNPKPLVTCDMLCDGVHFRLEEADAKLVGRKLLAVSLSDIAAMGGAAESAFLSLGIPKLFDKKKLDGIMEGFLELCKAYDVCLAGGDTNTWQGPFTANVTVIGRAPSCGPILRSGAKVGDVIFVTGPLGDSLASKRHFTFEPRLKEALFLADHYPPHAMVDISDGLSSDLGHILESSGVGARLDFEAIPVHDSLSSLPPQQRLQRALCDGEDFELCFTMSEKLALKLHEDQRRWFPLWQVGEITQGAGIRGGFSGEAKMLGFEGFRHQF